MNRGLVIITIAWILAISPRAWGQSPASAPQPLTYCIVDTGQKQIFRDTRQLLKPPKPGEPFFGQDGFYEGPQPNYHDNGDGTITDVNTRLMWVQARGAKVTWDAAQAGATQLMLGDADGRVMAVRTLEEAFRREAGNNERGRPYSRRPP